MKPNINKARGEAGEEFAINLYKKAKFQILQKDYRAGRAQVDFVAYREGTIHFVEVKYRKTMNGAHDAITIAQINRITQAAEVFMNDHPNTFWQIDLLLINKHFKWQRIDNISQAMH